MPTFAELIDLYEPSAALEPPATWNTGIDSVDEVTLGGFRPGEAWLVTGAPGSGKTTLLLQWAARLARDGHSVMARLPREDDHTSFARVAAAASRITRQHLMTGAVDELGRDRWARERDALRAMPLTVVTGFEAGQAPYARGVEPVRPDVFVLDDMHEGRWSLGLTHVVDLLTLRGALVLLSTRRSDVVPGDPDLGDVSERWADACAVVVDIHRRSARIDQLGNTDLRFIRNRRGPASWLDVEFQGHYARFSEVADGRPVW